MSAPATQKPVQPLSIPNIAAPVLNPVTKASNNTPVPDWYESYAVVDDHKKKLGQAPGER